MPPDPGNIEPVRVTVLGLGRMGRPVARNLAAAGFAMTAWNRTALRPGAIPQSVAISEHARSAVAGANIVILLLSDRSAIEDLLFQRQLSAAIPSGATVIDMGTTGPLAARDHAEQLAARGIRYLDAPVSGGVRGAEARTLTILTGGDRATFDAALPVLSALGTAHWLGPVGAGQTAKLANQIIVACSIAAVAEGLRFAEDQGLDGEVLVRALQGGFADSPILRQHGQRMARRDFAPGGTVRLHGKDLALVAELAGTQFGHLANTAEAARRFERLVRSGRGELDHAAYALTYEGDDDE